MSESVLKTFQLILCLFFVSLEVHSVTSKKQVPRYTINLDSPPRERWIPILQKHGADYAKIITDIERDFLPEPIRKIIISVAKQFERFLSKSTAEEISGIASYLNVSIGELVLPNLVYDITAFKRPFKSNTGRACTSIVAQTGTGQIIHGRNLDYGTERNYTESLDEDTIEVDFTKNGKILYTATTYLGLVGVLTGQRIGAFTVTVDERNTGNIFENIDELLSGKATLLSHLVRETLENSLSYEEAMTQLSTTRLAAPVYLIVGGIQDSQGSIITRDRVTAKDIWTLNVTENRWFLVETNYDHWEVPPPSDPRRDVAINAMNHVGYGNISVQTLFDVLSVEPVLNRHTTYTTIMSAADPIVYQSWTRCGDSKM